MSPITDHEHDLVRDSYRRCMLENNFLSMFHKNLTEKSDHVAKLFVHFPVQQQYRILAKSVARLVSFAEDKPQAHLDMRDVARILHDGNPRITPDLYAYWSTALMETICSIDSTCNDEVAIAWEQVISHGLNFLINDYESRHAAHPFGTDCPRTIPPRASTLN